MKTTINDLNFDNIYNIKTKDKALNKEYGLTKEIVTKISQYKEEPTWVLELRLKALETFFALDNPDWGPDISYLDINEIATFVNPDFKEETSWDDVPEDIKNVFNKLGIPEAEKQSMYGVGAQYDSQMAYHNLANKLKEKGVIYTNFDHAIKEYPELIKKYFTKLVPITDHKYIALHYALFSGGSFVYIPKGVKLDRPLQSYFRLNSPGAGQFEHTLIIVDDDASLEFIEGCSAPGYNKLNLHAGCVELFVGENASLKFSTIENWSKNMLNLNTKKSIVKSGGSIEWIMGSFGSKVSMLYPLSILTGDNINYRFTSLSFAGANQNLDTGLKVVVNGNNNCVYVDSKSISKDGGINTFRSNVEVLKKSVNSTLKLDCSSLMLDSISKCDTIPVSNIKNSHTTYSHEASVGKINDELIYYLETRGFSKDEATKLIVEGFAEPITKYFPVEYAVEMNRLINMELEGTIG